MRKATVVTALIIAAACSEGTNPVGAPPITALLQGAGSNYEIQVVDLAPVLGSEAEVADINDVGHMTGTLGVHAFFWSADVGLADIGALVAGDASRASALNNRDEVVGTSGFGFGSVPRAFRWTSDGGLRALPVFEDAFRSAASDINDDGEIVGSIVSSRPNGAVLWESSGAIVELGELRPGCGCSADPRSINEDGVVVGVGFDIPPSLGLTVARGFVWDRAGGMTSLGTLGYEGQFTESNAYGINASGHVVGESDVAAFLWTPGTGMEDLRVSDRGADARAINDAGFIVGVARFQDIDGDRGYVRLPDGAVLVLPPIGLGGVAGEGAPFSHAVAINNRNEIAGMSTTASGDVHPTLWRLVPMAANRAPVAVPGGPYAVGEGSTVVLDGNGSSDPDGDALTFAWNFGDGATNAGPTPQHIYVDNGEFTVALTVTDPAGLSASATTTASVANIPPAVGPVPSATLIQREIYSAFGGFTDPGADTWTAAADYGDGAGTQALQLAGKAFSLSHQYRAPGAFTLQVTVADDDGGVGVGQATVVVLTFQQATERLSEVVDELAETGGLSGGNANALNATLDAAISQLDKGNEPTAVNQLDAFISQVEALGRSGRLSEEHVNRVVGEGRRVIQAIETP